MIRIARFALSVVLPALLIATAGVALAVRMQPHDDHDLRELLMMESCETPCFAGVVPGEMRAGEALALVAAHPWVGRIDLPDGAAASAFLYFIRWGDERPSFVTNESGQIHLLPERAGTNYPVDLVQLETSIPLSDFYLFLGAPSHIIITPIEGVTETIGARVQHRYFDGKLMLSTIHPCPLSMNEFLAVDRVTVRFSRPVFTPTSPIHWRTLFNEKLC